MEKLPAAATATTNNDVDVDVITLCLKQNQRIARRRGGGWLLMKCGQLSDLSRETSLLELRLPCGGSGIWGRRMAMAEVMGSIYLLKGGGSMLLGQVINCVKISDSHFPFSNLWSCCQLRTYRCIYMCV